MEKVAWARVRLCKVGVSQGHGHSRLLETGHGVSAESLETPDQLFTKSGARGKAWRWQVVICMCIIAQKIGLETRILEGKQPQRRGT